jgi:hypothetical protein
VRSDLLSTLTQRKLDEIARYANDQLRIKRRGLAHRGGYLDLPEGWAGLRFEDLALDIQENFGVALPAYHAIGDRWLTAGDLGQMEGIGPATSDKFGELAVNLTSLAMAAEAFGGSPTIPIQQDVAGPPLRGADGSIYLFRIIATDPSRPPESVDEARDALVEDLNKLAHYGELVEAADSIRRTAVDEGLLALALAHDTKVQNATPVSLIDTRGLSFGQVGPSFLPVIGPHEETITAIIDHALSLPQDVPAQELAVDQRLMVIPVEDRLAVLVALIKDQTPLTRELYRSYAASATIQRALLAEELADISPFEDAFSYEALAERHNFELAAGDVVSEEEQEPLDQVTGEPAGADRSSPSNTTSSG